MQNYFYDLRYQVDNTEWRARAKRELVFQLWKKYQPRGIENQHIKLLDFGCGTGVLQEQFEERFNIKSFGIDTSEKAIDYCKKRGLTKVKIFNGKKIPFQNNSFDLVTAIDVLEHIKNDSGSLKEINRVLKKSGLAILLVPAHPKLWSTRDINLQHFRRYSKGELENKCLKAGFKLITTKNVDFAIYFLFSLIHKLAPKVEGIAKLKMDSASTNIIFNEIMFIYEQIENKLQNLVIFPVGLSILVVVQKI